MQCMIAHTRGRWLMVCLLAGVLVGGIACSKDDEQAKQRYFDNANALVEQDKHADAIVEYRNALRIDPRFGEARLKLGDAYAHVGDARRAVAEYIRAADLLPDNVDAQVKAGSVLLLGRRFEDAKARAEKALAAQPDNVEAQILLGNALAGLKDLDGALREVEEAVALAPEEGRGYSTLGAVQLARGDSEEAEKAFRRAVEVENTSVQAQLSLANFLVATGRRDEAEKVYVAALELDPSNKLANRALVGFHLSGGNPAGAEPYLVALAEDEADAAARVALGEYYFRLRRFDDARRVLTAASNEAAVYAPARTRLAALAFAEQRPAEGYRLLDEVLVKDAGNIEALVGKGRMLRLEGKRTESLEAMQAAVQAAPEAVVAQYELGVTYVSLSQHDEAIRAFREVTRLNPRAAAAHMQLANLYLSRGEAAQSLTAAEDALRNAPGNPLARLVMARSQMAQGNFQAAGTALEALQKEFPNASIVSGQIGTLRMLQGNLPGARAAFDRALQLQPGAHDAVRGLVQLDLMERKPQAAIARVDALLASSPNDPRYLIEAARAHGAVRDFEKAEALLRRAVQADNTSLQAYSMLGQLFMMMDRRDEALAEFEALSKKQPNSVPTHTMVAMLLQSLDRESEARARYERVIEIDPQAPVAANNLAWMYAENGENLDVALQLAQAARRGLPNQAEVADTLGWVYYKRQQYTQAIREFTEAVEKDPENGEYHYRLGLAHASAGDPAKARAAFQKAVASTRPFASLDAAKQALSELPS